MRGDFASTAYDVTLIAVCLYAAVRGGRPERWGAFINVAGWVLSSAAMLATATRAPVQMAMLAIDIGMAAGFYRLATTTTRFWPIWALGLALSNLFATAIVSFLPENVQTGYLNGRAIYSCGALFVLALGSARLPADADEPTRSGVRPPCQSRTNRNVSASPSYYQDPSSKP